jgi:phosphate transport system substrate-binding protein
MRLRNSRLGAKPGTMADTALCLSAGTPNRSDRTSNMIPAALARLAAALCMAMAAGMAQADEIKIGGTGAALGTMQMLADAFAKRHPGSKLTVLPSMGSGGGIKAVLAGATQVAVSARPLTEAETKAGGAELAYGRTPFVFATSASSKASGVTTQDLVDIYRGTTEQWPDGSKIRLVMRPLGDSDSEVIKAISPAMRDAKTAAEQRKGMLFTVTDQETAIAIESTPGGLGPSTLALLLSERRHLKALSLDGVIPDAKSLANGSYPLYKQMFIVTGPHSPSAALAFVAFVRSVDGRAILQQAGHWVP